MWGKKKDTNDLKIIEERLNSLYDFCNKNAERVSGLNEKVNSLFEDFNIHREESTNRIKRLNILLNEKLDSIKEDNENILIGISKSFNQKIDNLSEGKPLVQDLLKKIAYLESLKESIDHRRSTNEVISKLTELNDAMLTAAREEKSTDSLEERVNILKWVLGEI